MHEYAVVNIFRVIIHRSAFKILQRCGGNGLGEGKVEVGCSCSRHLSSPGEIWNYDPSEDL